MLRRLLIENLVLIRRADLSFGPGLNVVTGETGAGKTIFTHAIGLLLGTKGDAALLGAAAAEAYVEAELDLPEGLLSEEGFETAAGLAPEDEPGVVLARRLFADGRSRAYAWGRALPREDLAGLAERLVAMSGQFEQRRLGRPAHQLDLLDAYAGEAQTRRRSELAAAWRALRGARAHLEERQREAGDQEARLGELRALVAATDDLTTDAEDALRAERDRLRNAAELADAAVAAAEALVPDVDERDGAADLAAVAGRALQPVAGLDTVLAVAAAELDELAVRLREAGSSLRGYLASLEAQPGRLEEVERRLTAMADAKRRFEATSIADLVERAAAARAELELADAGADPLARAQGAVVDAEARYDALAAAAQEARAGASGPFADAGREELERLGLGDGELAVTVRERAAGPTGRDEVELLIRANAGLPLAPVAATASGGELSRIALALRAVAHAQAGEPTILFDEIDAGVGGTTAHAVADALRRLSARSQVIAITHLPQIASVADRHFRVEKVPGDPTHTRIELLGDDERQAELERMLGGQGFLVGAGYVRPGEPGGTA
jgi:DNA repair protein RecN (Recombination protein N)